MQHGSALPCECDRKFPNGRFASGQADFFLSPSARSWQLKAPLNSRCAHAPSRQWRRQPLRLAPPALPGSSAFSRSRRVGGLPWSARPQYRPDSRLTWARWTWRARLDLGATRSRRVGRQGLPNLVRPLTEVCKGVTWIDERAIASILALLREYQVLLGAQRLGAARFQGIFTGVTGSGRARADFDARLLALAWLPVRRRAQARRWVVYTARERNPRKRRLKVGFSCKLEHRAKALDAGETRVLNSFGAREHAFAVEQGLHGLFYPFRVSRPARAGVHSGDTEWYSPWVINYLERAAKYFSKRVLACAALRERSRRPTSWA